MFVNCRVSALSQFQFPSDSVRFRSDRDDAGGNAQQHHSGMSYPVIRDRIDKYTPGKMPGGGEGIPEAGRGDCFDECSDGASFHFTESNRSVEHNLLNNNAKVALSFPHEKLKKVFIVSQTRTAPRGRTWG
jgi:hypothetical protein